MNKIYLLVGIIVLAVVLIFVSLKPKEDEVSIKDYKNISYTIEGQSITLVDGFSEIETAPGSAGKIVTRYFGNEVKHDLNDDGREDIVFLVTQERGGSGTFFYAVAALNTPTRYVGSDAFFLGDRIAPQSTNIDEGVTAQGTNRENVVVINFATRGPNEPFTAEPTIGKSVWIKLDTTAMQWGEVAQNFEGESL
ncbi:hypothetical protein KBB85_06510 [Patescibacteria group bacterium]|jgi:hypothetical protein|nr:hypothetical protein [Patescibacteria group bacterium]